MMKTYIHFVSFRLIPDLMNAVLVSTREFIVQVRIMAVHNFFCFSWNPELMEMPLFLVFEIRIKPA